MLNYSAMGTLRDPKNPKNILKANLNTAIEATKRDYAAARGFVNALSFGLFEKDEKRKTNLFRELENENPDNPFYIVPMKQSMGEIAREKHSHYYGAGYLAGEAALYKGLGTAAKGVKGLNKIKNPFLRDFAANAIADTAVNAGEFVSNIAGGKKISQAASDFAKNQGIDLGLNFLAIGMDKVIGSLLGRKALNANQYRYYRNNLDSNLDKRMKELMDLPEFKKLSQGEQAAYLAQMKKAAREEVYDAAQNGLTKDAAEGIMESNSKWFKVDGTPKWPENNGFAGQPTKTTLQAGTKIDRYGNATGNFAAPDGTPYSQRSLPPGSENSAYHTYEVIKPFDVQAGITAPWFDQLGGGTQYLLPMSIQELIKQGYIK